MMEWHSKVVDDLCEYKRAGLSFNNAWELAIKRHPPKMRDRRRAWDEESEDGQMSLLARTADEETTVDFLFRVASDAWFGRNPQLRHIGGMRDGDLGEILTNRDAA